MRGEEERREEGRDLTVHWLVVEKDFDLGMGWSVGWMGSLSPFVSISPTLREC